MLILSFYQWDFNTLFFLKQENSTSFYFYFLKKKKKNKYMIYMYFL